MAPNTARRTLQARTRKNKETLKHMMKSMFLNDALLTMVLPDEFGG
jgi:hypothetical protein